MNLLRKLRIQRRNVVRTLQITYAACATRMPATYPDFMCIGAPRAATTWLHTKLRSEPQVYLPKAKELHFFDEQAKLTHYENGGLRWYRSFYFDMERPAHFRWYSMQFRKGKNRIKGEITPSYSMLSKERVRFIFDTIPDLKIIYIIRNPIDRAWSTLRQVVLFQKGANHRILNDSAWVLRTVRHPVLLEGGNYRRAIETWGGMAEKGNILYLFYEDIVENPQLQLKEVYSFLDLDWPPAQRLAKTEKRVNAAPARAMPREVRSRLIQHYQEQIEYLEERFNRDLRHWTRVDDSAHGTT